MCNAASVGTLKGITPTFTRQADLILLKNITFTIEILTKIKNAQRLGSLRV
jgi:hypothetical protein